MSTSGDIAKAIASLKKIKTSAEAELPDIGKESVDIIKSRSKSGYGVSTSGSKQKFKAKKDGTASNITDTGHMLEALNSKSTTKNTVTVGYYSGKMKGQAEGVSKDRPFNQLTKAEQAELTRIYQLRLNKKLTN